MDTFKLARISLTLLRAFDGTARHLSFSRAAAEMGRSQATLSVQVRELEQQLQVRLLDRTTRRVSLTEAGEVLARSLQEGFNTISAGLSAAREFTDDRRGRVSLACAPSLSGERLPSILARYRRSDATTQIDIQEMTYLNMVEAISEGRVDFGVGPCLDPPPSTITFTLSTEDPLCVLLSADHEGAHMEAASLNFIASLPLIFLRGTVPLQKSFKEVASAHGLTLTSRTQVRQVHTAIGIVRAGGGAAIIPRLALPDVMEPGLVALPIVDPPFVRRTGVLTPRGRPLGASASRLARYISGALANAKASDRPENVPAD